MVKISSNLTTCAFYCNHCPAKFVLVQIEKYICKFNEHFFLCFIILVYMYTWHNYTGHMIITTYFITTVFVLLCKFALCTSTNISLKVWQFDTKINYMHIHLTQEQFTFLSKSHSYIESWETIKHTEEHKSIII